MGRFMRITAQEVLDQLKDNEYVTIAQLSDYLDCSPATIRSRLRGLREDGEAIIHSSNGLSLVNREVLQEVEKSEELQNFVNWMLSTFKSMILCASPVKPLLPTMKRTLKLKLDKSERKELMQSCARVTALLAYIDAEEDFD